MISLGEYYNTKFTYTMDDHLYHIEDKDKIQTIVDLGQDNLDENAIKKALSEFPNATIYFIRADGMQNIQECRDKLSAHKDRTRLFVCVLGNFDDTLIKNGHSITYQRVETLCKKEEIKEIDILTFGTQCDREYPILLGVGSYLPTIKHILCKVYVSDNGVKNDVSTSVHNLLCKIYGFTKRGIIDRDEWFSYYTFDNKYIKDQCFKEINLDFHTQTHVRGKPFNYMKHICELFNKLTNAQTIVEIGTIRCPMSHNIDVFDPVCCNDGHSTYFWNHYTEADILSVDGNIQNIYAVNSQQQLYNVQAIHENPLEFAKNYTSSPIDMLYLDYWDVQEGSTYAEDHVTFYNLCKDKLAKNCIIVVDDTDIHNRAKISLLKGILVKDGFYIVCESRVTIFMNIPEYEIQKEISGCTQFVNTPYKKVDRETLGQPNNNTCNEGIVSLFDKVNAFGCEEEEIRHFMDQRRKRILKSLSQGNISSNLKLT